MTPQKFINDIHHHIDLLVEQYSLGKDGPTYLGHYLDMLNVDEHERDKVISLIRLAAGEAIHSLISGIEGKTPIGERHQKYQLISENGNDITGDLSERLCRKLEKELDTP